MTRGLIGDTEEGYPGLSLRSNRWAEIMERLRRMRTLIVTASVLFPNNQMSRGLIGDTEEGYPRVSLRSNRWAEIMERLRRMRTLIVTASVLFPN